MYSRRTKKWVRTQYQGVYEIFGSLSVVYMIIERYARKNIRGRYQEVRP